MFSNQRLDYTKTLKNKLRNQMKNGKGEFVASYNWSILTKGVTYQQLGTRIRRTNAKMLDYLLRNKDESKGQRQLLRKRTMKVSTTIEN